MSQTIKVDARLFDDMRYALTVANEVLTKYRLVALDQNPKGVRDLVGSAAHQAEQVKYTLKFNGVAP